MEYVITYIDGFNLYFGLRSKGWKHLYWLDLLKLSQSLLKREQELTMAKYFTARVSQPEGKRLRQQTFLEAVETLPECKIFYGKYQSNPRRCLRCGYVEYVPSEKMTDVNIAAEMLEDAFLDRFDTAVLVSADSDLVAPLKAIRRLFPNKRVVLAFPPDRVSAALKQAADGYFVIGEAKLANCQLPDEVRRPDGFLLRRSDRWR